MVVAIVAFAVLVGLAYDCADACASRAADDGSLEAAAEDSAEDGSAACANEGSFARPDAALIAAMVVVVVTAAAAVANSVIEVGILISILCAGGHGEEACGQHEGGDEYSFSYLHHAGLDAGLVGCVRIFSRSVAVSVRNFHFLQSFFIEYNSKANLPCLSPEVGIRLGVSDLDPWEVSMKLMLAGSLVLILAVVQTASGQDTPGPAPTAAVAGQATAPAGGAETAEKYRLAEGTDVELQFAQDLSSSTSFEGDPVALTLTKELKVGDVVVAKAGSSAYGVVTKAHKSGMMGKSGQLEIRLDYLKAGDNKIKLRQTKEKESEGGVKGALLSPFGHVKHGKNVEISVGDPLHAYVAQDTLLPPVS